MWNLHCMVFLVQVIHFGHVMCLSYLCRKCLKNVGMFSAQTFTFCRFSVFLPCVFVCVCVCRCSEPECSLLTSCSQQLAEQVSQGTAFSSLNNNISQLLHQMCVVKFEVYIPISIMDISLLLCTLHSVFVSPCMSRSIVSPCTLCT